MREKETERETERETEMVGTGSMMQCFKVSWQDRGGVHKEPRRQDDWHSRLPTSQTPLTVKST